MYNVKTFIYSNKYINVSLTELYNDKYQWKNLEILMLVFCHKNFKLHIYKKKDIYDTCLTYRSIAHNSYFPLLGWHIVALTNWKAARIFNRSWCI